LAKSFADQGVELIAVDSNDQDSLVDITNFIRQQRAEFPIYKDQNQGVLGALGAVRTPEAFVLDRSGRVYYRGRIDDSSGIGYRRPKGEHNYLEDAVARAVKDRSVSESTEAVGCIIGQRGRVEPHGEITFSPHVATIFYRSCLECHREGQLAPFSLLEYESAASWGEMIAEVIEQERMPPWFANPQYGHFSNDSRLSPDDRQTILTWVKNGCPEGDPKDMPTPPSFPDNWRIDDPDQVVYMSEEPIDVPAEGPVDYQVYFAETHLKEDRWIQQAEVRPGNPEVVHHCSVWVIPPGSPREVYDAQPSFSFAPGVPPLRLPADAAVRIPAGSGILFQLHYEPNGRPAKDRSYIGMKFVDGKQIRRPVVVDGFWPDTPLQVPANASDHRVHGSVSFTRDAELVAFMPHMHLRGTSFRYELEYPDGHREIVLDVPRYDFNWQSWYNLAKPISVPKGSRLIGSGAFDNSSANPRNSNPDKVVPYGPRTEDEMFVGIFAAYDRVSSDRSIEDYAFNAEGFGVDIPNPWKLDLSPRASATLRDASINGTSAVVSIERLAGGLPADIKVQRNTVGLLPGQHGLLLFRAKASKHRPIRARLVSSTSSSATTFEEEFYLHEDWQNFEKDVVFPEGLRDPVIVFDLGQTYGTVEFNRVMLVQGSRR
jgi:hypothetical protein